MIFKRFCKGLRFEISIDAFHIFLGISILLFLISSSPVEAYIQINNPPTNSDTRISPITVSGTISTFAGSDIGDSVSLPVNGVRVDSTSVLSDSSWTASNVILPDTSNVVGAQLHDTNTSSFILSSDTISITYDTGIPDLPSLLSPVNATSTTATSLFFDWTDSSDTISGISNYRLQIATDSGFNNIFADSTTTTSDLNVMNFSDSLFYWRVYARDQAGNTSGYTSTDTFIVDRIPPNVSFSSPVDGDTVFYTETLTANTSDTLSGLSEVRFWEGSIGGSLLGSDTTGNDGWTSEWNTVDTPDGVYNLIIESTDAVGNSDSSAINVTVDNSSSRGYEYRVNYLRNTSRRILYGYLGVTRNTKIRKLQSNSTIQ